MSYQIVMPDGTLGPCRRLGKEGRFSIITGADFLDPAYQFNLSRSRVDPIYMDGHYGFSSPGNMPYYDGPLISWQQLAVGVELPPFYHRVCNNQATHLEFWVRKDRENDQDKEFIPAKDLHRLYPNDFDIDGFISWDRRNAGPAFDGNLPAPDPVSHSPPLLVLQKG